MGTGIDVGSDVSGSLRAHLGYAWDHALLYATGGWEVTRGYIDGLGIGEEETFNGWTVGAGVDYAFTNNAPQARAFAQSAPERRCQALRRPN